MESDQEADDFQRGWDEEGNESEGADEDAVNEDEDDEEVFLRGNVLTGHAEEDSDSEETEVGEAEDGTGLDPEYQEEESDDELGDLFKSTADAEQLLQGMSERQGGGTSQDMQPYQLMGIQRKRARQADAPQSQKSKKAARAVFGADVDADLEYAAELLHKDAEQAEQMNLGPVKGKARRMRDREKRRAKNAAAGKRTKLMPEEAVRKMGEATLAYATHKYPEAMSLLWEVIRLAPNMPDAYHTLGALHDSINEPLKAINFYMIAAHLDPKDVALWKRLASMSTDLDPPYLRQALYCLNRVITRDKEDMDAKWDRALLLSRVNEPRRAIQALEQIAELQPGDAEVAKMLARLHHRLGDSAGATKVLQELLTQHPESVDLTHVNMLAELLIKAGQPRQVLDLIQEAAATLCGDEGLPIELQAKAGVCAAQLGEAATAQAHLEVLADVDAAEMPDLFQDSADQLLDAGFPAQALRLYRQMSSIPELSTPDLWSKLSACLTAVGDHPGAADVYRSVARDATAANEHRRTALMALAELLSNRGQTDEALASLRAVNAVLEPPSEDRDHQAALALTLQRAHLFRKLGREEEYMQLMLPLVNSTLDHIEGPATAGATAGAEALQQPAAVAQAPRLPVETPAASAAPQPLETDTFIKGFPARKPRRGQKRSAPKAAAQPAEAPGGSTRPAPTQTGAASVGLHAHELPAADASTADPGASQSKEAQHSGPGQAQVVKPSAKAAKKAAKEKAARQRDGGAVLGNAAHDEQQYEAVVRTARALLAEGKVQEASQLAHRSVAAFGSKDRSRNDALELVLAAASLAQHDADAAMQAAVRMVRRWPGDWVVWNAFCRAAAARGQFPTRVVAGIHARCPHSVPAALLLGSAHSLAGQHSAALDQLSQAVQLAPAEALPRLLLGITHATAALSRKTPDRDRAVLLAFTFLQEYAQLRGCEQEAAYNTGRAAHQLGLVHLAVPLYERALACSPPGGARQPSNGQVGGVDLRWEAAHNLVLALRASGAEALAAAAMRKHLVI